MWILIFLFFISVLILGWVLFGYYIWLFLLSILKEDEKRPLKDLKDFPLVSLLVPVYNEELFILKKIENIKSLDYPAQSLEVIFIDAGSSDKTAKIIEENKTAGMKVLKCPCRGKVNQLNFGLKHCVSEFIFVTDADGVMSHNSIREVLREFKRDKDIHLAGIYSYPENPYVLDRYYWLTQNKGRILESRAFGSSIVIAVCYAFRKSLIQEFPSDVIADDVYISFLAHSLGYKVSYIDRCSASELRGPADVSSFINHKFRKCNALLRETLRFIYKLPEMNPLWKTIFITKTAQLILVPWLFTLYVAVGACLVSLERLDVFFLGSAFLFLLLMLTSRIISSIKKEEIFPLSVMARTFLLSNLILFAVGLSFIFFKQDSSYKKINVPRIKK